MSMNTHSMVSEPSIQQSEGWSDEDKVMLDNGSALHMPDKLKEVDFLAGLGAYCQQKHDEMVATGNSRRTKLGQYHRQFFNDWSHRTGGSTSLGGSLEAIKHDIFSKSNLSFNEGKAQIRYLVAKQMEALFGTAPFFGAVAQGPESGPDRDLSQDIQHFLNYKFGQPESGIEQATMDAIHSAATIGYGITKTTYRKQQAEYSEVQIVLHDDAGMIVKNAQGDMVYHADARIPQGGPVIPLDGKDVPPQVMDPYYDSSTGDKLWHFAKVPEKLWSSRQLRDNFRPVVLDTVHTGYTGSRSECVFWEDFYADETKSRLEDCDFLFQKLDLRVSALHAMWKAGHIPKALYASVKAAQSDGQSTAASGSPGTDGSAHESILPTDDSATWSSWTDIESNRYLKCAECYPLYEVPIDWDEEGNPTEHRFSRLFVLFCVDTGEVIYADYLGNITPGGELPFHAWTLHKRENKWFGVGVYEEFEEELAFVDDCLNQMIWRNNIAANPCVIVKNNAFIETKSQGKKFSVGAGKVWTVTGQSEPDKALFVVSIPDLDQSTLNMADRAIQKMSMTTGITAAVQGDPGQLSNTSTATGVKQIMAHGSVLLKVPVRSSQRSCEAMINFAAVLTFANLDRAEIYVYFEGDSALPAHMAPDRVHEIDVHVTLRMTRFHQQEAIEISKEIIAVVKDWITIPPEERSSVRGVYLRLLQDMGMSDADSLLQLPQGMGMPGMDAAGGGPSRIPMMGGGNPMTPQGREPSVEEAAEAQIERFAASQGTAQSGGQMPIDPSKMSG